MSKPKLTPWFESPNKPVRVGVYEVCGFHGHGQPRFQYWDGGRFRMRTNTPLEAFEKRSFSTIFPNPTWRGLAKEPK